MTAAKMRTKRGGTGQVGWISCSPRSAMLLGSEMCGGSPTNAMTMAEVRPTVLIYLK